MLNGEWSILNGQPSPWNIQHSPLNIEHSASMYPWRRILVPTDFSTASEWVFDDAVRLAGSTDAELVILHIRMTHRSNPTELRFPADPSLYDYAEQYELERLRKHVANAKED